MKFDRKRTSNKALVSLYTNLLKSRLIEEKMVSLVRQGKISKWFSGIGQEGVAVGATLALKDDEYILPMHRNLGVFTSRDIPLGKLFSQIMGKNNGFTKGRDRSFHFGTQEHHIIGMISHMGAQLAVADGVALADKLQKNDNVTLVFTGEGGASEGDFHEALNLAAVWELPVIFLVENNSFSISTPIEEQYKIKSFTEKGPAYGISTYQIDGNNVLEVYNTIKQVVRNIKNSPKPVLIEATTFRMRGHEENADNSFIEKELFEKWAKEDPLINFEDYIRKEKILSNKEIDEIIEQIESEINEGLEEALKDNYPEFDEHTELNDVYATSIIEESTLSSQAKSLRFVDAIKESLDQNLDKDDSLVLMGQDIAEFGGVFKVTEGLYKKYGKERVRNTPLCESAVLGTALGLSVKGMKSVIEMQFSDFVTCGFNQIVNNLAKTHYRWGQNVSTVVRMPTGAGVGAGPFHSQSTESWFFHTPGLKIYYPSTPSDAKGLLNLAIKDPNPVLFFEHKALYRSVSEDVPENLYFSPEKGKIVKEGDSLSIITYGMGVHWAMDIVNEKDLDVEIIDLRILQPWDKELVYNSVKKTGKALIINEDTVTGSISAEIASSITENCFENLDAPVKRVGSLDTPIPFAQSLEKEFLPKKRLETALEELLEY